MILQAAIRGVSQKRATALNNVKYGGELTLYQRKLDKKKVQNIFLSHWQMVKTLPTWPSTRRVTHS
jgi:hypothetical protein